MTHQTFGTNSDSKARIKRLGCVLNQLLTLQDSTGFEICTDSVTIGRSVNFLLYRRQADLASISIILTEVFTRISKLIVVQNDSGWLL